MVRNQSTPTATAVRVPRRCRVGRAARPGRPGPRGRRASPVRRASVGAGAGRLIGPLGPEPHLDAFAATATFSDARLPHLLLENFRAAPTSFTGALIISSFARARSAFAFPMRTAAALAACGALSARPVTCRRRHHSSSARSARSAAAGMRRSLAWSRAGPWPRRRPQGSLPGGRGR